MLFSLEVIVGSLCWGGRLAVAAFVALRCYFGRQSLEAPEGRFAGLPSINIVDLLGCIH